MFKSKRYFLKKEREITFEQIAKAEIDVKVLEQISPEAVVGKKQLGPNSTQDILAKELLATRRTNLDVLRNKLKVIEGLL